MQAAHQGISTLPIAHTGPGYTNSPDAILQQQATDAAWKAYRAAQPSGGHVGAENGQGPRSALSGPGNGVSKPGHDWIYAGTPGQRCLRCNALASELMPGPAQSFPPCPGPPPGFGPLKWSP
jgi:hypothetical protein